MNEDLNLDLLSERIAEQSLETVESIHFTEEVTPEVINKQRRTKGRVDYSAIKAKFIIGEQSIDEQGITHTRDYTLKELAGMFNVSYSGLIAKSAKEQWVLLKTAYRARINEQSEARSLNLYSIEAATADIQGMIATNKLNRLFQRMLNDKYGELLTDENTEGSVNPKDLREAVSIAKDLHALSKQITASMPSAESSQKMYQDLHALKRNTLDPRIQEEKLKKLNQILQRKSNESTDTSTTNTNSI